jgi:hypothetical protein
MQRRPSDDAAGRNILLRGVEAEHERGVEDEDVVD